MSKSAMQELMENVEHLKTMGVTIHWEKYLEKEKEQIIDAYENGYEACDMDEAMEVNKKLTSGDLYYNMNYNQNK
jgi:N-acetyl-anhydromuramyl-L-alanine amidase AmpD